MPESSSEAGPSSQRPSSSFMSRRRSSSTRSVRSSRPIRPRATSSISARSDASNISGGLQQISWTTGDCFDYVDDDARISAFLHCPICLGPFLDPFASNQCSHTFCKQCIATALSSDDEPNKRCPTCRTPVELTDFQPTALLIKNMVDTLHVRCPNKDKGCDYECERHLLRGHVASDCAYEYVDQNLNEGKRCGCAAKVMRKDWASHGLTCPKRKTSCPTCDTVLCADEMEQHSQKCSPEPATCEYCGWETIKSRLNMHVANECQSSPVPCPHAAFGCDWVGPRRRLQQTNDSAGKRKDQTHLNTECRFEPLKAFFSIFGQQMAALSEENSALRSRVEDLESKQHGQSRRIDDCIHSLGSWYRSAGELRNAGGLDGRERGSEVGVDGEWDEFPLDAGNWERSLSQQSAAIGRQGRAQSASAVTSMDLASWARRQYSDFSADLINQSQRSTSANPAVLMDGGVAPPSMRYLSAPAARSMPTSSVIGAHSPSPSRERTSFLDRPSSSTHRSFSALLTPLESAVSPGTFSFPPTTADLDRDLDRTNLDTTISSLTASIAGLSSGLSTLDKRTEEGHIAAVKAGFDAGRVQEEVASLRHGLHAVRMQMHQILMTQQRHALFSPPMGMMGTNAAAAASANGGAAGVVSNEAGLAGPSSLMRDQAVGNMPMLSPPLMRRWAGLEHTKL